MNASRAEGVPGENQGPPGPSPRRVLLCAGGTELQSAASRLQLGPEWSHFPVRDGEEAIWSLRRLLAEKERQPIVLVADFILPPRGAIDLCRFVRSQKGMKSIPFLMVSDRDDPDLCIQSLECGADDFLRMPVSLRELLSRIRALVRRSEKKERRRGSLSFDSAEFDGLVVNTARHEVRLNGKPVSLSYKEFLIMGVLVGHSDRALSYEEILRLVWGEGADAGRETLKVHIHSLRRKIAGGPLIEAIRGYGYRMRERDA